MRKILIYYVLFIYFLNINAYAQTSLNVQEQNDIISNFISSVISKVDTISKSSLSKEEKSKSLTELFVQNVNIEWMARFALGQHWQKLNLIQQKEYLQAYKKYLINSYIPKFSDYNSSKINIYNIKNSGPDQYLVQTHIIQGNNKINLFYRCKVENQKIQIIDIIGENISLLVSQREEFNSLINRNGIVEMIELLKNKSK